MPDEAVATTASSFYVQRNPEESALEVISDSDREQLAEADEFTLNSGLDALDAAGEIEVPKRPLEGWLLTALAVILLGELALAGWTTHQRRLRVKPVSM